MIREIWRLGTARGIPFLWAALSLTPFETSRPGGTTTMGKGPRLKFAHYT
jgi:hypothetical protein